MAFNCSGAARLSPAVAPDPKLTISSSQLGNSLSFLLIVDGPITDHGVERQRNSKLHTAAATTAPCSSWAEIDCSFRQRRDAVARCITAAITPSVPEEGDSLKGIGRSRNTACWLLFEQDCVLMLITSAFLDCSCDDHNCDGPSSCPCCGSKERKLYTEHAILTKLDQAAHAAAEVQQQRVNQHSIVCSFSGNGICVFDGFVGVAHCAAFVMAQYLHAHERTHERGHDDVPLVVAELQ
jgi:hypothetical protein